MKDKIKFIIPLQNLKKDLEMKRLSLATLNENKKSVYREIERITYQLIVLEHKESSILTDISEVESTDIKYRYKVAINSIKRSLKIVKPRTEKDSHVEVLEKLLELYESSEKELFKEIKENER